MTPIANLPAQLMSLLREHLSPEDISMIADKYGERSGHEGSLYDQLIDRAGVQQLVRVLVLHAVVSRDVMGLVRLIVEHYPVLQETLRSHGFETAELTRSYLAALQPEIKHSKGGEAQPETLRYFIRHATRSLHIQQDQPPDFTLLLPAASEAVSQAALIEVDLDEQLTTHQYVILSHPALAVTASVLRSLALRMIVDWQHAPDVAPFPVFVPFARWFNPKIDLHQFLQMHLTWLGMPQFAEVLVDLIRAGRVVLLMEGLDSLPFVKHNALTGLLDDSRVLSIAELSEEHQWRNVRCVLSCQVKDFLFGPRWHEMHVLDPANEQQPRLSDNPAITLKTRIDSVFEKASAAGQLPDGMTANDLQTRLSRLAFDDISSKNPRSHGRSFFEESDHATFFDLNAPEQKTSQGELQQEEQLSQWSQALGLHIRDSGWIYFSDEHIKSYLCLHYCFSHMRKDPRVVGRLQSVYARKVWWLWEAYDPELIDKLLLLLHSSDKETRADIFWILRWCEDNRAVEPLIEALKDADPFIRYSAASALGEIEDSRAIEPLIEALKDEDGRVRSSAVGALNKFGDQRVIEPLIEALKDEDGWVRSSAFGALNKFDDQRVIEQYIAALGDYYDSKSYVARNALARFGYAAVLPLMAVLMDNKRDEYKRLSFSMEADVPYAAAEILGEIGDIRPLPILMWMVEHARGETHNGSKLRNVAREAVNKIMKRHHTIDPLIPALHSEDSTVRIAASFVLGKLGDNRVVELLIAALRDEEDYIRLGAASLLENIGKPAVVSLIAALQDENVGVRFYAVQVLGSMGSRSAVEPLIAALADQQSHVRQAAVEALGKLGDKRALPALLKAAKDSDRDVRKSVGKAVYSIDPDRSVEILIIALQDKDRKVRYEAALHLIDLGDSRAVEPLIEALKDEDGDVRDYAAIALKKLGDSRAVEPLIEALKDEDWRVREDAAYALRKLGDNRAIEPLIENLQDKKLVTFAAADALGDFGDDRAIEPLISLLESSKTLVCEAAADALTKFGEFVVPSLVAALKDEGPGETFYSRDLPMRRYYDWESVDALLRKAELRYYTAEILGKVGDVRALPILMWMAAKDENETYLGRKVRDSAAQAIESIKQRYQDMDLLVAAHNEQDHLARIGAAFALGMLKDERATEVLSTALEERDRRVRWGCAELLGNLGSEQAIAALINALDDEDANVDRSAIAVLVKIGGAAIQPLLTALKEDNSIMHGWNWFARIAYILSEIGEAALQPLIATLKDQDDFARYWAANALGNIGNKQAVDALNTALEDDEPLVRLSVAAALTKLGDDKAIELLITDLKDEDENIRYFAVLNLSGIGDSRTTEALNTVLEDRDDFMRSETVLAVGKVGASRNALLKGVLLDEAKKWILEHPQDLGATEREFLREGLTIDGTEEDATMRYAIRKLRGCLLWFLVILELPLIARFVLQFLGADSSNVFTGGLYAITGVILFPLHGILKTTNLDGHQVEWSTLVGIAVYWLLFLLIINLLLWVISSLFKRA